MSDAKQLPERTPLEKSADDHAHVFLNKFLEEHGFIPYAFHRAIKEVYLAGAGYMIEKYENKAKEARGEQEPGKD